jgi:hypothetical protein
LLRHFCITYLHGCCPALLEHNFPLLLQHLSRLPHALTWHAWLLNAAVADAVIAVLSHTPV